MLSFEYFLFAFLQIFLPSFKYFLLLSFKYFLLLSFKYIFALLQTYDATYDEVKEVVSEEIRGSGSYLGYRWLWSHLKTSGLLVRREDVRLALHELDPENVSKRRRHRLQRRKYRNPGPNYVWHIDGHDKLKPYGLSIHGCIDGYFRRIIWLEVASTNKVPELILSRCNKTNSWKT